MDIRSISEQDFLRFGNLRRLWKAVRLLTCTIFDREIEGVDSLIGYLLATHLGTKPLKRGKKQVYLYLNL